MITIIQSEDHWAIWKKWLFRFLAAYIFWYIFPFPLTNFPFLSFLNEGINTAWNTISLWFGDTIFHLEKEVSTRMNGSGDKTIDYLSNFSVLIVALVTGFLWSILDRKRANYNTLLYWLEVLVRFYLAATLMGYGFAKIFKTQFPFPSLNRLIQPYGDSSPMGLAWTFMGYSPLFNYFTGFGEALAGFLLCWRKTKLLGAFIGISVMSTIVAMNYGYDIPVKLFSSNLLFMLCLLLIPDYKRIVNFLFLNKTAAPALYSNYLKNNNLRYAGLFIKYGFIAYVLYSNVNRGMEGVKKWGDQREKPPLYGLYTAKTVVIDSDTIPPLITDDNRWHQLAIDFPGSASIKMTSGKTRWCTFKPDTTARTIEFEIYNRLDTATTLNYQLLSNDQLLLEGILSSGNGTNLDTISVILQKEDLNQFLLVKRGFNWVNEYPFNR